MLHDIIIIALKKQRPSRFVLCGTFKLFQCKLSLRCISRKFRSAFDRSAVQSECPLAHLSEEKLRRGSKWTPSP